MQDKKAKKIRRGRILVLYRRAVVCAMMLFQLFIFVMLFSSLAKTPWVAFVMLGLTAAVVIYILMRESRRVAVLPWVVLCIAFPVFGGLLYFTFHLSRFSPRLKENKKEKKRAESPIPSAEEKFPEQVRLMRYLSLAHGFSVYGKTEITYLPSGEKMHEALLDALASAKRYIYLEYFIIEHGRMWESMHEILRRKAALGVKVRVMYDDVGCFLRLPSGFAAELAREGIECAVFNPFRPMVTSLHNHRDHRKIAVVDGEIAITGGANIADEYINEKACFGHWKDAAVLLRGAGAAAFAEIFMQSFRLCRPCEEKEEACLPEKSLAGDGSEFVQPYADSPMDEVAVSEEIYLSLIASARKTLCITTPYFIVSDAIVRALICAAQSGTEVSIVLPHRWDKRLVHMLTRSYYEDLIAGGVRVYEYSPGFIHSKTVVVDGRTAVVGTANFDYRSLRYHFECGAVIYSERVGKSLLADFESVRSVSREITREECRRGPIKRFFIGILRIFAPLV